MPSAYKADIVTMEKSEYSKRMLEIIADLAVFKKINTKESEYKAWQLSRKIELSSVSSRPDNRTALILALSKNTSPEALDTISNNSNPLIMTALAMNFNTNALSLMKTIPNHNVVQIMANKEAVAKLTGYPEMVLKHLELKNNIKGLAVLDESFINEASSILGYNVKLNLSKAFSFTSEISKTQELERQLATVLDDKRSQLNALVKENDAYFNGSVKSENSIDAYLEVKLIELSRRFLINPSESLSNLGFSKLEENMTPDYSVFEFDEDGSANEADTSSVLDMQVKWCPAFDFTHPQKLIRTYYNILYKDSSLLEIPIAVFKKSLIDEEQDFILEEIDVTGSGLSLKDVADYDDYTGNIIPNIYDWARMHLGKKPFGKKAHNGKGWGSICVFCDGLDSMMLADGFSNFGYNIHNELSDNGYGSLNFALMNRNWTNLDFNSTFKDSFSSIINKNAINGLTLYQSQRLKERLAKELGLDAPVNDVSHSGDKYDVSKYIVDIFMLKEEINLVELLIKAAKYRKLNLEVLNDKDTEIEEVDISLMEELRKLVKSDKNADVSDYLENTALHNELFIKNNEALANAISKYFIMADSIEMVAESTRGGASVQQGLVILYRDEVDKLKKTDGAFKAMHDEFFHK